MTTVGRQPARTGGIRPGWGRLVACLAVAAACAGPTASAGDFTAWRYRCEIAIPGYTNDVAPTSLPVLVALGTNMPGFDVSQFRHPGGWDLRFAADDGKTELDYERDTWLTGNTSYAWVKLHTLSKGERLFAYWGHAQAGQQPYTTNGAVWGSNFLVVSHDGGLTDSSPWKNNGTGSGTSNVVGVVGAGRGYHDTGVNFGKPLLSPTNAAQPHTVSGWINTTDSASGLITQYGSASSPTRFEFKVEKVNFWKGGVTIAQASQFVNDGAWHHIAFTKGASQAVTVCRDGLPEGAGTDANVFDNTSTRIGEGGQTLVGAVDEVRISDAARPAAWIWAEYLRQSSNSVFVSCGKVINQRVGTVVPFK